MTNKTRALIKDNQTLRTMRSIISTRRQDNLQGHQYVDDPTEIDSIRTGSSMDIPVPVNTGKSPQPPVWMIVEDDQSLRMMLSAMLGTWEKTPLIFKDGFETMAWLDLVEAGSYDKPLPEIALLDVRMPGPHGYTIAERMRKMRPTSNIARVIMTAYRMSDQEMQNITQFAQPDDLIRKPLLDPINLRQKLEDIIACKGAG